MRVLEVWRYPVKSLQGEQVDSAETGTQGLQGDRAYALFDVETGFGLTARRQPQLLFASARLGEDGSAEITLPDGSVATDDEALSAWLGRSVVLRSTEEVRERRYENPVDFEEETVWEPFSGSNGAFHDSGRASVSLVSTATIAGWEPRRFRSNLLLDGDGEDGLVGSRVRLGDTELDVGMRIERCVMVTRPQPSGIEKNLDVLRTIHRQRGGELAVGAIVVTPGKVSVGDEIRPTT
jgi:uncharacterized protein YcbX